MTPSARTRIECGEEEENETIEDYLERRKDEERFFGKPVNGMSASEALDLLDKAKPPLVLKIDRREFGPDGKELPTSTESED